MNRKLIEKIISRKEYSQLPRKDVELAFEKFDKDKYSDEEKVKLTRKLLREIFSSFTSQKLLSLKNKNKDWILRKHLSTRERLPYYEEIYKRVLKNLGRKISVIDLGSGINGFSYSYFPLNVNYLAIEAMGQLVDLMNFYFEKEKLRGRAIHLSLFELDKVKKIIKECGLAPLGVPQTIESRGKVIFLFKIIDSLEMLKRDYSKKLILEIGCLADRIVVSFAVKSMGRRIRFKARRDWIINFIQKNFKMIDDFELGGERYLSFRKASC